MCADTCQYFYISLADSVDLFANCIVNIKITLNIGQHMCATGRGNFVLSSRFYMVATIFVCKILIFKCVSKVAGAIPGDICILIKTYGDDDPQTVFFFVLFCFVLFFVLFVCLFFFQEIPSHESHFSQKNPNMGLFFKIIRTQKTFEKLVCFVGKLQKIEQLELPAAHPWLIQIGVPPCYLESF